MGRVPRLLAVTDLAALGRVSLETWLGDLAAAGVDAVQLRAKGLADRELLALARRARTSLPAATLSINGRPDVALVAGADGVHLPADGLPVPVIRGLASRLGRDLLVGRSTHRPEEVAAARDEGADYVTFGPVYATPSKAEFGAPQGLEALARAAAHGLPVLAIGGLSPSRLPDVAAAGAAGAAGIRMFLDPADLVELVGAAGEIWGG